MKAGGKIAAKIGGKVAAKAGGEIGAKLGAKVAKGFGKVEKLTGGKLGNAAELQKKAGNQLKQTAFEGVRKIAGNKQERLQQEQERTNQALAANQKATRSSADGGGGGYSNPGGASSYVQNGNNVIAGTGNNSNKVVRTEGSDLQDSLDPDNIVTQENRQFLPEELNVKGFTVPVAGISRLAGAMIKTKQENNKKILNKKDLKETAVLSSNKILRQRQSTADKESKFSKIAKDVAGMDRKKQLTQGIKPSYKKSLIMQESAGKVLNSGKPVVGTRVMRSNNSTIMPNLRKIDNIPYKGNAVLNANK